jgi:hypothetical protein
MMDDRHCESDGEARLDIERFVRSIRGALVNIGAITKVTPMPGGVFRLHLTNGQELQSSRFHCAFSASGSCGCDPAREHAKASAEHFPSARKSRKGEESTLLSDPGTLKSVQSTLLSDLRSL